MFSLFRDRMEVKLRTPESGALQYSEEYSWGHPKLEAQLRGLLDELASDAVIIGYTLSARGLTVHVEQQNLSPVLEPTHNETT